ncbi:hypothetical protein NitYY0826_C1528 [Nitratiruptor sp. YY08-26]|uniref:hypothetical protein n=1 Tax=unclassified Nitratiruptor TaxID=2624044 RepID=UPI0019152576|nr:MULTISPECIES: hypothetical protein [unclassified Nitratiruptor]BCD62646.1 hypothetical protein NitYY0813_C1526 [Nitratiruptor sp. YY08-13]BCD66582.1 hypothetical protein NitYY0826_C1528 [Nitratiruptor sp. YY08-26]
MKTANLNSLIEARGDIEFASETIKMIVAKMEKENIKISYRLVLEKLADMLDRASLTLWNIESNEMERDNESQRA